jgi:mono/diheme cytochrome c family protein
LLCYILALLVPLAVLPFALVTLIQSRLSESPRVQIVQDMGNQPRLKTQAAAPLFADGRAMRLPVPGTVARGQLDDDDFFYRGYTAGALVINPQTHKPEPAWLSGYPAAVHVGADLLRRGRERFNIYCAPCHGEAGYGDGMVHRHALALQTPGWIQPANLHESRVAAQPNGRIFNTLSFGNPQGKMPPYAAQIPPEDRWAIIAYLRALQLSQAAPLALVPADVRAALPPATAPAPPATTP